MRIRLNASATASVGAPSTESPWRTATTNVLQRRGHELLACAPDAHPGADDGAQVPTAGAGREQRWRRGLEGSLGSPTPRPADPHLQPLDDDTGDVAQAAPHVVGQEA